MYNFSVVGSQKHIFKVDKCLQAIVHFEIIYAERAPHIIQGQIDQFVTIFRQTANNLGEMKTVALYVGTFEKLQFSLENQEICIFFSLSFTLIDGGMVAC